MIETLLVNANYKSGQSLKLMELWADKGQSRKGWVMVHESEQGKIEQIPSQEALSSCVTD